ALPTPLSVLVGGGSAAFTDEKASLADHLPAAIALVIVTTLIVLFLMTGSVILPIKAVLMNALNLSAVFGILVLIFQHGNLEGLLGYRGQGGLDSTQPVLLFAVAFGLSTDYGVFLLSRVKEARDGGASDSESVAIGLERTGRIVTAAALLFAVAMLAFATSQIIFIKENGIGTALAVLIDATVIRALLAPSLMALLGTRVNALAPKFLHRRAERDARPAQEGFWYRLSQTVQRVPGRIAIASAAFLIALGIPFLSIKFTWVDAQILPKETSARQVDNVLRSDFPPFRDSPIRVLAENASPAALAAVAKDLRGVEGIAQVNPPRRLANGDAMIDAISQHSYLDESSLDTVRRIRELPPPAGSQLLVTGASAGFIDFQSSLEDHLPAAIAIVIVATMIVLFLMTGSVVLPVKQLVMNVLNLSAVFGILVFIFQDGRLEGLLDYRSQGAIEQTMPILLFAVAFGLSTDYGVFLLSRIKEARDHGANDSECVAIGLERTGRIVTAAAVLFSIAIGAFATSQIIFIKENGIGTALAVLIDATIIRALLVPSLMELLGKWNWWAPRPLRRLHDRFGLSETPREPSLAETPGRA
ncbi:MAG: MMPL family transporter, partial [Solirubrobacterales bacterium]